MFQTNRQKLIKNNLKIHTTILNFCLKARQKPLEKRYKIEKITLNIYFYTNNICQSVATPSLQMPLSRKFILFTFSYSPATVFSLQTFFYSFQLDMKIMYFSSNINDIFFSFLSFFSNKQKKIMILVCVTILGLLVASYVASYIPGF